MGLFVLLAILAFFVSSFAFAGFHRAWRGAVAVLLLMALYIAFLWSRPAPAYFDEQDQIGAAAWQLFLLIVTGSAALAFAAGFAFSAVRSRLRRGGRE